VELILMHLDGLLPPARVVELETHLADCSVCRAELLLQKRIRDALSEEIYPRLSIDFTKQVTQKTLEIGKLEKHRSAWLSLVPAFALFAVTLLLFVLRGDLRTMLPRVLGPTGSVLSVAVSRVGQALTQVFAGTGGIPDQYLSGLAGAAGPLLLGLLLLLSALPVVWCFQKVGEFLRE
jgi:anti-sigma factor RsiW